MPAPGDGYRDERDANGDLVCRVDPSRGLVEIKHRGRPAHTVDLVRYGLHPAEKVDNRAPSGYTERK